MTVIATSGLTDTPRTSARAMAMLVVTLTAAMLGDAALAAGSARLLCEKRASDMQSLDVALESLTIDKVDHAPSASPLSSQESLNAAEAAIDGIAPMLSISSEVESFLDRVFASDADTADVQPAAVMPQQFSGHPGISPTPESAGASAPVAVQATQEMSIDEEIESGALRRHMYRKDI